MDIYKTIIVKSREIGKKSFVKTLIKSGFVPGVIYLKNKASSCVSVSNKDIIAITNDPSAMARLYDVNLDGKNITCLLKEVQFNPANNTARSVDFMEVEKDDVVTVNVPIRVINKEICPGVKSGGDVYLLSYNVDLKCRVCNIPYAIEIDVKDCQIGSKFFLSDIKLPEGCKMINDTILLRVAGKRVIKEIEDTAVSSADTGDATSAQVATTSATGAEASATKEASSATNSNSASK